MAGLDGIEKEMEPHPRSTMTFTSSRRRKRNTSGPPRLPLGVLDNLEKDHAYLLKGDVFTEDLIAVWIEYKRKREDDMIG